MSSPRRAPCPGYGTETWCRDTVQWMAGQRKRDEKRRMLVSEGVLAYLRDEDADVLNIIESAMAVDPLLAALDLTAFAGKAIRLLAESSGEPVEAVVERVRGSN